jgi:hypothetical protein
MRLLTALLFALAATLTLGACIEANVDDGVLLCALDPNRPCPRNYYCASNGYCYHDGHAAPPKRTSDTSAAESPAPTESPASAAAIDMTPPSD